MHFIASRNGEDYGLFSNVFESWVWLGKCENEILYKCPEEGKSIERNKKVFCFQIDNRVVLGQHYPQLHQLVPHSYECVCVCEGNASEEWNRWEGMCEKIFQEWLTGNDYSKCFHGLLVHVLSLKIIAYNLLILLFWIMNANAVRLTLYWPSPRIKLLLAYTFSILFVPRSGSQIIQKQAKRYLVIQIQLNNN